MSCQYFSLSSSLNFVKCVPNNCHDVQDESLTIDEEVMPPLLSYSVTSHVVATLYVSHHHVDTNTFRL